MWYLQIEDREFLVRVSYMEIYNEEINDLLAPENRKLQIHESVEVVLGLWIFLVWYFGHIEKSRCLMTNLYWSNLLANKFSWFNYELSFCTERHLCGRIEGRNRWQCGASHCSAWAWWRLGTAKSTVYSHDSEFGRHNVDTNVFVISVWCQYKLTISEVVVCGYLSFRFLPVEIRTPDVRNVYLMSCSPKAFRGDRHERQQQSITHYISHGNNLAF